MPAAAALADAHSIRHTKAQYVRRHPCICCAVQPIAAYPIDPGIRAHPQEPARVLQNPDHPRRQLSRGHAHDPARAPSVQSAIIRSNPKCPRGIFVKCSDHIARKPVLRRVVPELPVVKPAQPTQRPNPQRAVAVLCHRPDQIAAQPIERRPRREPAVLIPRQPAPRPDPQFPVAPHLKRSHKIVGQSVRRRERPRHLTTTDQVQPIRRSHPHIAICGCSHREHHIARQTLRRR